MRKTISNYIATNFLLLNLCFLVAVGVNHCNGESSGESKKIWHRRQAGGREPEEEEAGAEKASIRI
jgi:hypothetical protein